MGSVFKRVVTRPLPAGAEIFTRGEDRFTKIKINGKTKTVPVTIGQGGNDRIRTVAAAYTAEYRRFNDSTDQTGVLVGVAIGCRDEANARRVLGDLERRVELVKAGVVPAKENAIADRHSTPLANHFAAYMAYLKANDVNAAARLTFMLCVIRSARYWPRAALHLAQLWRPRGIPTSS